MAVALSLAINLSESVTVASYKGIEVKEGLRHFLPHMPRVEEYREMLQSLQAVWDNLSLLGQMSGTTAEMGHTRAAFSQLTGDLLNNLAEQTLAKRHLEMAAKSQVVIDILVRNLFERTADIGFLATDEEIRRFAAQPGDPEAMRNRFREYVAKYSVYEDVVLLSPGGEVLARLAPGEAPARVSDSWVQQAQSGAGAYVEYYGRSDLFPGGGDRLVYAWRVTSAYGEVLGVLGLYFRFEDEMERIFAGLSQADDAGVLILLDEAGKVIASQDRWQVPLGARIPLNGPGLQRVRFAGRNYFALLSASRGYQGYMGPGWRGLILVPLDQAFEVQEDQEAMDVPDALLASVLNGGRAFPAALRAIPGKADTIQRNLNRSVWNGTVRHSNAASSMNAAFSKILLWEISRTGMRMREVFGSSIGNLQTTVLSSLLSDARFLAGLAIDIMDRNLYERANDCRWWALDATLRRALGRPAGRSEEMAKVLSYINGLYTVYSSLLVFDATGAVVAVSRPEDDGLVGQVISEPWVERCLGLNGSQAYTVSAFAPTALYGGESTYIYAAAIRTPDDRQVCGGIGIVFDGRPQFEAMLQDVLPREEDGTPVDGSFAAFLAPNGQVIACSDCTRLDRTLVLPPELLNPAPGGASCLIEFEGQVMAVGARRSEGYREYKGTQDAYRNEVVSVIFVPLGAYDQAAELNQGGNEGSVVVDKVEGSAPSCEIATFSLANYWLGLPVSAVVEAIELADAARLANAPKQVYGALIYQGETLPIYNLHAALGLPEPDEVNGAREIIIIRGDEGRYFGILVDALGEVPEIRLSDITDVSSIYVGITPVLASVVKTPPGSSRPMLTLLSVDSMINSLKG